MAFFASWFDVGALCFGTIAYQKDSSGFVALISFMNIVYAYICDQVLFHEERINSVELVSALVIVFVAIGVAIYKITIQ